MQASIRPRAARRVAQQLAHRGVEHRMNSKEEGRGEHAADHAGADGVPRIRAGAGGNASGVTPTMNASEVIRSGAGAA